MESALRDVFATMLRRPKAPLQAMYSGPRGSGWVDASVVHDGDRRWRISTFDETHLDDGRSAFAIDKVSVVATRSGGMAAFGFLKAMVQPAFFADLNGRLPIERTATVVGFTTVDERECWELSVAGSPNEQRWLVDRTEGYVLAVEQADDAVREVARLSCLTLVSPPDSIFEWNGDIDDDLRAPR